MAQAQPGQVEHVIHISVDGLRGDLLADLMEDEPTLFPNFWRIKNEGATTFNARTDYTHTVTVPNHISMITGRPVAAPEGVPEIFHHGFEANFPPDDATIHSAGNPQLDYIASSFDVVHDAGLSTAFFATKDRLEIIARSYNAEHGAADLVGVDNGRAKIDTVVIHDYDTPTMIDEFVAHIETTPIHYTFMHIVEPDDLGHSEGWGSEEWNESIVAVDSYLGQLLAALDGSTPMSGSTAILVTADHGGGAPTPRGHSVPTHEESYTIPLLVWGADVPAGSDLYDIFNNRFDPTDGRPSYTDEQQPLRNGDTGNMALQLLGLPTIPGSMMVPDWSEATDPYVLDFDNDQDFDVDDLDSLTRALCAAEVDLQHDVNGDQQVNVDDLQVWLREAAMANGAPEAYRQGDTNLDLAVDAEDFENLLQSGAWLTELGEDQHPVWSIGNFNADCFVDGSDFNLVFANRTPPSDFAAVPEPTFLSLPSMLLFAIGRRWAQCRPRRA